MPSTCCSVPHCSNRGGHVFPKILKLKKKWIKAIKRNMDRNKYQLFIMIVSVALSSDF
jgi:hypothetical protein